MTSRTLGGIVEKFEQELFGRRFGTGNAHVHGP